MVLYRYCFECTEICCNLTEAMVVEAGIQQSHSEIFVDDNITVVCYVFNSWEVWYLYLKSPFQSMHSID